MEKICRLYMFGLHLSKLQLPSADQQWFSLCCRLCLGHLDFVSDGLDAGISRTSGALGFQSMRVVSVETRTIQDVWDVSCSREVKIISKTSQMSDEEVGRVEPEPRCDSRGDGSRKKKHEKMVDLSTHIVNSIILY